MSWQQATNKKLNNLIDQLNELAVSGNNNEMLVGRCKREARALLKTNPGETFELLGIIATIEGNVDAVRENYRKSVNLRQDKARIYYNYAVSLHKLGLNQEAIKNAGMAVKLQRENLSYLYFLTEVCWRSGAIQEASQWLNVFESASPSKPFDKADLIRGALHFFTENKISGDDVLHLTDKAYSVLREANVVFPGETPILIRTKQDESQHWISYQLRVTAPVEQIVDLNEKIAMLLVEDEKVDVLSMPIVINCIAA